MATRLALLFLLLILFLLAPAVARAQGSLDISLPVLYHINSTSAYDSSGNVVNISGNIRLQNYANVVYAAISTDAPEEAKLAFFQDTTASTLFRNNTLILPVSDGPDRIAGLVLSTDDMICENGTFYGTVTGIELDTKAMDSGDSMVEAIMYLSKWPDQPDYQLSITQDENVKKSVMDAVTKDGVAGNVKLMVDISGDSIGYVIVRMKAPEASGNVSAFRYSDGSVTRLTCKEIKANDSVIYETISTGGGTFAFVGPFKEPPPVTASTRSLLIFAGGMTISLLVLVAAAIMSLKWLAKKG